MFNGDYVSNMRSRCTCGCHVPSLGIAFAVSGMALTELITPKRTGGGVCRCAQSPQSSNEKVVRVGPPSPRYPYDGE